MAILSDLRVVEISGFGAAAVGAKHLADWGAQVTVLEPAGGSPLRDAPPYYETDGLRKSATWAWLSRGKTSVRPGVDAGRARAICEAAEVCLIDSEMAPAVLGLDPAAVRSSFAGKTTIVLISPFAPDGPYAGYSVTDIGIHAKGGWMTNIGEPDREPLRPGGELMWRVAGNAAFTAAMIALRYRRQGGTPQHVDVSAQAVAASMLVAPWLLHSMLGVQRGRSKPQFPGSVMPVADGYVGCSPLTAGHWELMCQMMGIADTLEEPGGRDPAYRAAHADELYERVRPWLEARTRAEFVEEAQTWRLPAAAVQNVTDRLKCPQLEARRFFVSANIDGKDVKVPRVPYLLAGHEPVERGPLQETTEVAPAPRVSVDGNDGVRRRLPFEGIRIADLTHFWSGPYAMGMLGALGADVIKIESVQRCDPYRYTVAPYGSDFWYEKGPIWNDANINKRDITLDLTSADGKRLFEQLVRESDIVISNFSNRVMPNMGYTNEQLLAINPRLIAVVMPGYAPGGPWENYVGYGVAFEQLAVCASVTGYADSIPTIPGGFSDPTVGLHVVAAIELALIERERTDEGVSIEIPQCEVLDSIWAPEHIAVQRGAPIPSRRGNQHDWMAPHNAFQVRGEDDWITIAVTSDGEFRALLETLGLPELLADGRFSTVAARKANEAILDKLLGQAVKNRDGDELERQLQAVGVKACMIVKAWRLPDDPNMKHIGFFQDVTRQHTGTHAQKTWPFRFTSIDMSHKRPPPLLGEHNEEVLTGVLGVSQEELRRLEAEKIIGTEPIGFRA